MTREEIKLHIKAIAVQNKILEATSNNVFSMVEVNNKKEVIAAVLTCPDCRKRHEINCNCAINSRIVECSCGSTWYKPVLQMKVN